MAKKDARSARQIELARLSWEMQEIQKKSCKEQTVESQRDLNAQWRWCYNRYIRIIGKADVEGWEKFALFVLGYKPDLGEIVEEKNETDL